MSSPTQFDFDICGDVYPTEGVLNPTGISIINREIAPWLEFEPVTTADDLHVKKPARKIKEGARKVGALCRRVLLHACSKIARIVHKKKPTATDKVEFDMVG